jgi:hypothetical protein
MGIVNDKEQTMTVAELMARLERCDPNTLVQINAVGIGRVFDIDSVFEYEADERWDDPATVIIQV